MARHKELVDIYETEMRDIGFGETDPHPLDHVKEDIGELKNATIVNALVEAGLAHLVTSKELAEANRSIDE